jgi:hypothetical protein
LDSHSLQLKTVHVPLPLKALPAAHFLHHCAKPLEVQCEESTSLENVQLPVLAEESICLIPSNFNQTAVRREIRQMAGVRLRDTQNALMVLYLRQRGVTTEDRPLRLLIEPGKSDDYTMLNKLADNLGISLPEAYCRIATNAVYRACRRLTEQSSLAHVSAEDVREAYAAYMKNANFYIDWVDTGRNESPIETDNDGQEDGEESKSLTSESGRIAAPAESPIETDNDRHVEGEESKLSTSTSGSTAEPAEIPPKDKIVESVRESNLNEYERKLLSCVVDRSKLSPLASCVH